MKYTLNYVKDNLSQNYPDILNEETIILRRKKQYDNIFQCNSVIQDDDFSVNEDDFFEVMEKFAKKDTKTNNFIIKSGNEYRKALFCLVARITNNEEIPDNISKTVLHMLWKRK